MKNFNDVIQQLIKVNQDLTDGKIDIEKAKIIGMNTQILINAAKVQLDYVKQTKQTPVFLNEKKPIIEELKEIAHNASKLNQEEEDITDKRPFGFNESPF